MNKEYEKKIIYRLIRVTYIISMIIGVIASIDQGWSSYSYEGGNMITLVLWSVFGTIGWYLGLNLIRETLNYIFFGKKLTWNWLGIAIKND